MRKKKKSPKSMVNSTNNKKSRDSKKQALTTRLMQISIEMDKHIYNGVKISASEAQNYIKEICSHEPRTYPDAKLSQVMDKILYIMKKIIADEEKNDFPMKEAFSDNAPYKYTLTDMLESTEKPIRKDITKEEKNEIFPALICSDTEYNKNIEHRSNCTFELQAKSENYISNICNNKRGTKSSEILNFSTDHKHIEHAKSKKQRPDKALRHIRKIIRRDNIKSEYKMHKPIVSKSKFNNITPLVNIHLRQNSQTIESQEYLDLQNGILNLSINNTNIPCTQSITNNFKYFDLKSVTNYTNNWKKKLNTDLNNEGDNHKLYTSINPVSIENTKHVAVIKPSKIISPEIKSSNTICTDQIKFNYCKIQNKTNQDMCVPAVINSTKKIDLYENKADNILANTDLSLTQKNDFNQSVLWNIENTQKTKSLRTNELISDSKLKNLCHKNKLRVEKNEIVHQSINQFFLNDKNSKNILALPIQKSKKTKIIKVTDNSKKDIKTKRQTKQKKYSLSKDKKSMQVQQKNIGGGDNKPIITGKPSKLVNSNKLKRNTIKHKYSEKVDISWIEGLKYIREVKEEEFVERLNKIEPLFWNSLALTSNWDEK